MPKTYLHHPDGSVTVEDTRTVDLVYAQQLERLRTACTESILSVAPEHTQRNAALGIVPSAPVVADITVRRDRFHSLASELFAAFNGPGTVSERCDAMEEVQWQET
jgi:hypothetical protein